VLEKIPLKEGNTEARIIHFYSSILDASPKVSALKPNYAFFAQYGFEGLRALRELIAKYKGKYPIILDAKRGDISTSAGAYAREIFEFYGADATTVSPYTGSDSIKPFMQFPDCFSYVLCRTSNPSAGELQSLKAGGKPLYLHVAQNLAALDEGKGLLGAVVGATAPKELRTIAKVLSPAKGPLLIPGVGSQGASAKETAKILKRAYGENVHLCLINASSSINYAYLEQKTEDFAGAALKEIERMNKEIHIR